MAKAQATSTSPKLIAPCGINCRLCYAYVRDKNVCPGCLGDDASKPKSCVQCAIKNCEKRIEGKKQYCFECDKFPCARIKHLDKRYRTKYGTSVIENLTNIKKAGIRSFVKSQNEKWTCPGCGSMLCMHRSQCITCGYIWLNEKWL